MAFRRIPIASTTCEYNQVIRRKNPLTSDSLNQAATNVNSYPAMTDIIGRENRGDNSDLRHEVEELRRTVETLGTHVQQKPRPIILSDEPPVYDDLQ